MSDEHVKNFVNNIGGIDGVGGPDATHIDGATVKGFIDRLNEEYQSLVSKEPGAATDIAAQIIQAVAMRMTRGGETAPNTVMRLQALWFITVGYLVGTDRLNEVMKDTLGLE